MLRAGQKLHNFPGGDVLRHEVALLLHQLFPNIPAELHAVRAAAIDRHRLRPYLLNIGPGSFLIVKDMALGPFDIAQHRQKSPVPGTVQREKIHGVRCARKHALTLTVSGLRLVGHTVGVFLTAEEGAAFLHAPGVVGGQHFAHFDDPVAHKALKNLVIVQPADVIAEPFILHRQKADQGGFANPLPAHQTQDFLILAPRMKHTPDRAQQEVPHQRFRIIVLRRAEKVVQAAADAGRTVPCKAAQLITNGVIPILVGDDIHRCAQLLLTAEAVMLLQV